MGQPFTGSQVIGPSWNIGTQQHPGGKATLAGPSGGGTHHTGPSNPVFPGLNPGKIFFPELPKLDPLTLFSQVLILGNLFQEP
jgi:hypothetical protein